MVHETTFPALPGYIRNIIWGLFYFFLYILVHAYLIARHGLHIDEVIDFSGNNSDIYIAAGRWGIYAYRELMGQGMFPITSGLVAGIYISGTILFQTCLFKFESSFSKALYGIIYIACNQWANQLVFSFQCDAIALALLLCTYSVYLIFHKKNTVIPIVLLVLSVSTYQCCAFYFLGIYGSALYASNEISFKGILHAAVVFLLCILFYFLINLCIQNLDLVTACNKVYVEQYQDKLTQWDNFSGLTPLAQLLFILHYGKLSLFEAFGFGDVACSLQPTAVIPLLILSYKAYSEQKGGGKIIFLAILIFIWALPFTMHLALSGSTPQHYSLLGEPVSLAFLWSACLVRFRLSLRNKSIILFCFGFVLLKAAYTNTAKERGNAHTYQRLVQELDNIHLSAKLLAQGKNLPSAKIILLSDVTQKGAESRSNVVHKDLLRNYIDMKLLRWYIPHLRLYDLISGDEKALEKHKDAFQTMSCWPEPGSMIIDQGEIIVRMHP